MKREDILNVLENVLINSNIDTNSKLWKNAIDVLIAIQLKEIED
jgi:hypothetical protein